MESTKKIKKAALALFAAVSIALLWVVVRNVRSLLLITAEWNTMSVIATSIGALVIAATLVLALVLLKSVRTGETPFQMKNVNCLKAMAALLVAYEPYMYLYQQLQNRLYPIILDDGIRMTVHSSVGGVVFAAGLVVFCVSLVFEYGISLQQQVDETL